MVTGCPLHDFDLFSITPFLIKWKIGDQERNKLVHPAEAVDDLRLRVVQCLEEEGGAADERVIPSISHMIIDGRILAAHLTIGESPIYENSTISWIRIQETGFQPRSARMRAARI
jgi:hypothetical protein